MRTKFSTQFPWDLSHFSMMSLLLLGGAAQLHFGERIPVHDGLAWEGVSYAKVVQYSLSEISEIGLDAYNATRIFQSLLLNIVSRILQIELSSENIILAFGWLNIICLCGTLIYFIKCSRHLGLRINTQWAGFLFLFLSAGHTKLLFYRPVVTDAFALMLAMMTVYFVLAQKNYRLLIVGFVGSFVWPMAFPINALLFLLSSKKQYSSTVQGTCLAIISTTACGIAITYFTWIEPHQFLSGESPAIKQLLPLSMFLLFCLSLSELVS